MDKHQEEELFVSIYQSLLMSEYSDPEANPDQRNLEGLTHRIMDNPERYPQFASFFR